MPIALFPFVIFPYELGVLADKKIGEKELIIIGLLIMVLSTFIITQIHSKNVLIWAAVLFLTRTGASIVESMASVYFYKKIDDSSAGEIALFSSGIGSFAYIIMPLVAFVLLSLFELPVYSIYIFICLALLFGLKYAIRLHDTL